MLERKIVICDDEKEILRYLRKILKSHGYSVDTYVQNLRDRLDADTDYVPALLVQDKCLPGVDGNWILKKTSYHKNRSAEILGITRKTFDRKKTGHAIALFRGGTEGG